MASFSAAFPNAIHVFPLTAARNIFAAAALLSKRRLGESGVARRTTKDVDRALGFDDFVHFYLARSEARPSDLPILRAQLAPASLPAVPHAAVVLDTSRLGDGDCAVCNWNIAVGRPKVDEVCNGGNWSRGTSADRIAEVWDQFRESGPSTERARGFWCGPRVPILRGERLSTHWRLMRKAKFPELLLLERLPLTSAVRVVAFHQADERSLQRLDLPPGVRLGRCQFEGYSSAPDALDPAQRGALDAYLSNEGPKPSLDFDGRRSRPRKRKQ